MKLYKKESAGISAEISLSNFHDLNNNYSCKRHISEISCHLDYLHHLCVLLNMSMNLNIIKKCSPSNMSSISTWSNSSFIKARYFTTNDFLPEHTRHWHIIMLNNYLVVNRNLSWSIVILLKFILSKSIVRQVQNQ